MKAKVAEKYRGLSRRELLDKAANLGAGYLENSHSCGQSTVAAIHDVVGFDDILVKASTSFCGGMAEQFLGTCGVLAGGIMVLDAFFGRPIEKMSSEKVIQENLDVLETAWEPTEALSEKFVNEYGTFICAQIHRRHFGRIYYLRDPEEIEKFSKAGGLTTAGSIVSKGVRWVLEILLDRGAIELSS